MKNIKNHLNLVNITFASLIMSGIALLLSWQANEIARSSIRPEVLVGAVTRSTKTDVKDNTKTITCKYRIRLLNTGGAGAVLTTADIKANVLDRSTQFTLNDFRGSGDLIGDILLTAYFDNTNRNPSKIEAHDSTDIFLFIEFESNKTKIIDEVESYMQVDSQPIETEIILKFPDAKNASTALPECAFIYD